MNKVTHINIGGIPFIMDEDAYAFLRQYFDSITAHFQLSEGSEEIVADIEARIAELLNEKKGARQIVQIEDVKYAIEIMGRPEDFGADPIEENKENYNGKKKDSGFNPGKRLYKNPEDKIVSGVCSGLSIYLGIKDPVWIRLVFGLLAVVGGGSGIPIYIILMVVLKDAKTPKEKLEMKGDPINLETLVNTMGTEFKNLGEQFKDFGKKNADGSATKASELGTTLQEGFSVVGRNLEAFLRSVARALRPIIYFIGGLLILALIAIWTTVLISAFQGSGTIQSFSPASSMVNTLAILNILLIILLPILSIGLSVTHTFFSVRIKPIWYGAIWGFWTLSLVSVSFLAKNISKSYRSEAKVEVPAQVKESPSGTYVVAPSGWKTVNRRSIDLGDVSFEKDAITLDFLDIEVGRSESDKIEFLVIKSSHGETEEQAEEFAKAVKYEIIQQGDTLMVPDFQQINEGQKFNNQRVELKILVPNGKQLKFAEDIGNLKFITHVNGESISSYKLKGKLLKMTENGIVISAIDEKNTTTTED
jgi:phage shock protein C